MGRLKLKPAVEMMKVSGLFKLTLKIQSTPSTHRFWLPHAHPQRNNTFRNHPDRLFLSKEGAHKNSHLYFLVLHVLFLVAF